MKTSYSKIFLVCFIYIFSVSLAFADVGQSISSGTQWLLSQQNQDGSFGLNLDTIPLDTAEAIYALKTQSNTNLQVSHAVNFLNAYTPSDNDTTSRIAALTSNSAHIQFLTDNKNSDGGWGLIGGRLSDPLDTALALQALKSVNYSDQTVINSAISYLLSTQNTDGGWAFYQGDPSTGSGQADSNVYMTAIVSWTLQQFPQTTSIATAINKATTYIINQQLTDGSWGTAYETAYAYMALVGVTTDNTVLGNAIAYLISSQLTNGSWNDDPYSTALALRALYYSENKPVPPPQPTTGSVTGTVIDAITNQPLIGVNITMHTGTDIIVETDETGSFLIENLPPGSSQTNFRLSGYSTMSMVVNIEIGQTTDLGTVYLATSGIYTTPDTAYNLSDKFGRDTSQYSIITMAYDFENNDLYLTTYPKYGCGPVLLMRYDNDTDTGASNLNNCNNPCYPYPSACAAFSVVFDYDSNKLFIGGRGSWWGGLHSYDLGSGTFTRVITGGSISGNMPYPMVYDPDAKAVYWGGVGWDSPGGDFFRYDISTGISTNLTGKVSNWGKSDINALLYDRDSHVVYLGERNGVLVRYNTPLYVNGTHPEYPAPDTAYLISLSAIAGWSYANAIVQDPDSKIIYFAGNNGKFARLQQNGQGIFNVTDLSSKISGIIAGKSINSMVIVGKYIYIGGNSGKFLKYDTTTETAVDLTEKIASFWAVNAISTMVSVPVDNAVYLGGDFGKFARFNLPVVSANMELTLDNTDYPASTDVNITAALSNTGPTANNLSLAWTIEDSQGGLVSELSEDSVSLSLGEVKNIANIWNTALTLAGDYVVHVVLKNGADIISDKKMSFSIITEKSMNSKISTDKIAYNPNEQVTIASAITSTSPNYIFSNLTAKTAISYQQSVFYTETKAIPILAPNQTIDTKTYWNASINPQGTYTVTLEVSEGTTLLSASTAIFEILGSASTGGGLTGTISSQPNPIVKGNDETLTLTITNSGNEDLANLNAKVLIVNPDTQEIKAEFSSQWPITRGGTITETRTASTASLLPGNYLAILQASTALMTQPKALASAIFEVKQPPATIEVTKTIAPDVTNLLVWVNDKESCQHSAISHQHKKNSSSDRKCEGHGEDNEDDKDNEDHGNRKDCIRLDLLENILKETAADYMIVHDKKDFQRELRNPYYTDILILGDHHHLEDHYGEELREKVYSGTGIISSLWLRHGHDEDGDKDEDPIFGIRHKDRHSGGYLVMTNAYGLGKAAYLAFDFGARLNDENFDQMSTILKNAIAYIHKPVDTTAFHPNQLVPVEIKLKSLGGAFDLRVTETYPIEIKLYNPQTANWITDNPWIIDIHLEADEVKTLPYFVLSPDKTGTYTVQTEVGYIENGTYTFYKNLTSNISVDKDTETMAAEIITALNALTVSGKDRAKVKDAVKYITNVQTRTATDEKEIKKNIHDVLKAIDSLLHAESADVSEVRLMIDALLRVWEGKYYSLN